MLTEQHVAQLTSSGISDEIITRRGYTSIPAGGIEVWRSIAGEIHSDKLLKRVLHEGALAFPLYRPGHPTPFTWILRPDMPRTTAEGKKIKYEYPRGVGNVLDTLPAYHAGLRNPDLPIVLTEGAKKADAIASHSNNVVIPINENGVWGWRSQGKVADDMRAILWEGRRVLIALMGMYGLTGTC